MGWVSPVSSLALVLVQAAAADPMGTQLHTRPHKGAACPWRWCGGHSGLWSSALAGVRCGCGHCLSQERHSVWGRNQSESRVVVHPWGHTAEWPLAPHIPHSCETRGARALEVGVGVSPLSTVTRCSGCGPVGPHYLPGGHPALLQHGLWA